jgi:hypothetical protein
VETLHYGIEVSLCPSSWELELSLKQPEEENKKGLAPGWKGNLENSNLLPSTPTQSTKSHPGKAAGSFIYTS